MSFHSLKNLKFFVKVRAVLTIISFFNDKIRKTLQKDYMGSDCALDMTSVDTVCTNLGRFLEWALGSCRRGSDKKLEVLDRKCDIIKNRQAQNQAASSGQRRSKKGSRKN